MFVETHGPLDGTYFFKEFRHSTKAMKAGVTIICVETVSEYSQLKKYNIN